jgi:hypothetical protein
MKYPLPKVKPVRRIKAVSIDHGGTGVLARAGLRFALLNREIFLQKCFPYNV